MYQLMLFPNKFKFYFPLNIVKLTQNQHILNLNQQYLILWSIFNHKKKHINLHKDNFCHSTLNTEIHSIPCKICNQGGRLCRLSQRKEILPKNLMMLNFLDINLEDISTNYFRMVNTLNHFPIDNTIDHNQQHTVKILLKSNRDNIWYKNFQNHFCMFNNSGDRSCRSLI